MTNDTDLWSDYRAQRVDPFSANRQAALASFHALGIPERNDESWKYTNAKNLRVRDLSPTEQLPDEDSMRAAVDSLPILSGAQRMVFWNGVFIESLSELANHEQVFVGTLDQALAESGEELEPYFLRIADANGAPFVAANTALARDAAIVILSKNANIEQPIQLVFMHAGDKTLHSSRVFIAALEGSKSTIVEHHGSANHSSSGLHNAVTELALMGNAHVERVQINHEESDTHRVHHLGAVLHRDAHLSNTLVQRGGNLSRNEVAVQLKEPGAHVSLQGLSMLDQVQHCDNHVYVGHLAPHCTSKQLYKHVLADASHGVFTGCVEVAPDAQKTDAQQQNPNLILSPKAQADTRPQLLIYADDVKCSHGATVGRLDELAMFYLRSRGLDFDVARSLLTWAFSAEVIQAVPNVELQTYLTTLLGGPAGDNLNG